MIGGNFFKKGKQKVQMFAIKKMMQSQLKGVPDDQKEMILRMVEEHPDFFEKIGKEIEQKKKEGKDEQSAAFEVMRKHQGEMQKLFTKKL